MTLDYLCQQLRELNVATMHPDDVEGCDVVINRAIDVRTACIQYLTSHILHDATPSGTSGEISHFEFVFISANSFRENVRKIFERRQQDNESDIVFEILSRRI